jgi:hypothetical protein
MEEAHGADSFFGGRHGWLILLNMNAVAIFVESRQAGKKQDFPVWKEAIGL